MIEKIKNIKLSNSVRRMAQGALLLGLAAITLTAVTVKQRAVVTELNILLKDGKSVHLIDRTYLKNILVEEFGSDLVDVPVEFIDMQAVEMLFNQDGYVKNAEVFVNKSGVLEILVEERFPIMRIMDPERSYYLDEMGVTVPLSSHYSARVPIVYLPHAERLALTENRRKDLVLLIKSINKSKFTTSLFDQIELTGDDEYNVVPFLGNEIIRLGDTQDLDDKLKRIELFYKKKLAKGYWNQCAYIDVRFKGQIVCGQSAPKI
jgi:cell division protein FtsQ